MFARNKQEIIQASYCFKTVSIMQFLKSHLSIRSYAPVRLCRTLTSSSRESLSSSKNYNDIPKVKGYPLIKTLPDYVKSGKKNLHRLFEQRMREYGPIYREHLPFQGEIVFTGNPEDFQKIFKDEPKDMFFDRNDILWATQAFCKRNNYATTLVGANEKQFKQRQQSIKNSIILPKKLGKLTHLYDDVTEDFLNVVARRRDSSKIIQNMYQLLFLWAIECTGITLFHKRLYAFDTDKNKTDPAVRKLVEGRTDFFDLWSNLEMGFKFYLKNFPSKHWNEFEKALKNTFEAIEQLCDKYQQQAIDLNVGLSNDEIISTCFDILMNTIEATSTLAYWSLIEMSQHTDVQDKIHTEVSNAMFDGIDDKFLQRIPYTRACLKEVFRMKPSFLSNVRRLNSDLNLSGYLVPTGTLIYLQTGFADVAFPVENADKFLPERWMKDSDVTVKERPHPFHIVPFGHGSRACMGRRLAENLMFLFYANTFSKYRVKRGSDDEVGSRYGFHVYPSIDIPFIFEER